MGVAAYVLTIVALRISGKRTLGQLNQFDFVVTVALGSTLATILLSADVSFAEGAVAIVLLIALQMVVAFVSSRWNPFRAVVTGEPTVLLWKGRVDEAALRRTRVDIAEVRQAVRQSGSGDLGSVTAVVLETNGTFSVVTSEQYGDGSAFRDIPSAAERRD
ncbi:DUF421 domain-containing protein [Microbacterium sp. JZ31]|uniref:DUF421 domain-containing protein n=1 Tax=Microbacterium sp. JZ31 TaxID=1906274 RepID=UPI001EE4829F|nr:YetF domain-containing protein [Microbacterium sp. JZ31]